MKKSKQRYVKDMDNIFVDKIFDALNFYDLTFMRQHNRATWTAYQHLYSACNSAFENFTNSKNQNWCKEGKEGKECKEGKEGKEVIVEKDKLNKKKRSVIKEA